MLKLWTPEVFQSLPLINGRPDRSRAKRSSRCKPNHWKLSPQKLRPHSTLRHAINYLADTHLVDDSGVMDLAAADAIEILWRSNRSVLEQEPAVQKNVVASMWHLPSFQRSFWPVHETV